jgi:hypothetical protein
MLLIFPVFIVMALGLQERRRFRMAAYASGALFLALSGLFTNWIFVS